MSTGEDEASSRNGRLRPRKSLNACTPSPQIKPDQKTDIKRPTERPKRSSTSSKASPVKQDDSNSGRSAPKSDAAAVDVFLCPYCDRKFSTRQAASKHARRIHLSTTKQDNFIKCLFCNFSNSESNLVINHMIDSHSNQYFACLNCHTRFSSSTELAEHKPKDCDKQKLPYRSKLRQPSLKKIRKNPKKTNKNEKPGEENENKEHNEDIGFNGIVISCELKPSETNEAADIEDKITTNLILPSGKTSLANTGIDKNAVLVLDDLQWNKRIPPNFSFHNTDADQILSRLGVVHRSPRVGETKKDLIKMMDEPNEKFEKCFDTTFYTKVSKNVQENLAKYVDGTFNFNPNKDSSIKTRKSKASVMINTAEGFPILLVQEQFTRHLFDGFMPRALAPKHKWKWDSTENDKSLMMLLDQSKRDSHANNCIITLISSLDIWTQLRMRNKFEDIYKTTTAKKNEKQNKISSELKEILESRDIPSRPLQVVQFKKAPVDVDADLALPSYLGLSPSRVECELQPAVLSGEWVRPRCYVCCACGEQTRDGRTITSHLATQHPNAQVQYYEIVGETLLSADILKHLYVPPSQMSNRTRPPRGFRDCTKCKKSVTLEDLHQHMLDCAGDTPTVRRKCRYRPFGVRRRRPRIPDNIIPKKMRKDLRARHRQKSHLRPRIRTEVGDAETIRKMIADLPEKRNRITPTIKVRPRRTILKTKKQVKLRVVENKKLRQIKRSIKPNTKQVTEAESKLNDTDNSSTIDEDDQPLKVSATRMSTRSGNSKRPIRRRITIKNNKQSNVTNKKESNMQWSQHNKGILPPGSIGHTLHANMYQQNNVGQGVMPIYDMPRNSFIHPHPIRPGLYPPYFFPNQLNAVRGRCNPRLMQRRQIRGNHVEHTEYVNQAALQFPDERIDVTSPGSSNVRQHSGRNNNNTQKSNHPGTGEAIGHNTNMSQVPNSPLKHSIARLTSDADNCDSSRPYYCHYTLPVDPNKTFIHQSGERKDFENESIVEEVDKPPLLRNLTLDEQSAITSMFIANRDYSQRHLYPHAAGTQIQEDPIEFRTNSNQLLYPNDPAALDRLIPTDLPDLPILNEFNVAHEAVEDLSKKSSKDLEVNKNMDAKIEIEKSKVSKTRKVLNIENCIAMIRTKKGLPFDKTASDMEDSKILDCELKNNEKTTESSKSETSLTETTTQGSIDTNSNDLTAASNEQTVVIDSTQTSKGAVANKSLVESTLTKQSSLTKKDVTSSQAHHDAKPELSIIKTTRHLNSGTDKKSSQKDQVTQKQDKKSISEASQSIHKFWLELYKLYSFWGSVNISKNYSIPVIKAVQMLNDLNIPCLTSAMATMLEQNTELYEEISLRVLYDFSFHKLYSNYNIPNPDENVLLQDVTQAHAYILQLPKSVKSNIPESAFRPLASTEKITEEKTSQQAHESPTSRRTRRKPIKKKNTPGEEPRHIQEQIFVSKYTTLPTVQTSIREDSEKQVDSHISHGNYMPTLLTAAPPVMDSVHLQTSPPPPYPTKSIHMRDSYKNISNSSNACVNNIIESKDTHTSPSDIHAEKIYQMMRHYNISNYPFTAQSYIEYERLMKFHLGQNFNSKIGPAGSDHPPDITKRHQVNKSSPRTNRGNSSVSNENSYKRRSEKLDSSEDNLVKSRENIVENARHETEIGAQIGNQLNNDKHRYPNRRSSEAFYQSSLEHDTTVPSEDLVNKSDRNIDPGPSENMEKQDNSSRVYQEPVAAFAPPSVTCSNRSQSQDPKLVDEETPLDLSFVSRKDKSLDDNLLPSDLSINKRIKEKETDDLAITPNIQRNFEPLHTLQHNSIPECSPRFGVDDKPHQQILSKNNDLEESSDLCLNNYNEVANQYNTVPSIAIARTGNSESSSCVPKTKFHDAVSNKCAGNKNPSLSEQIQNLPGMDNYPQPCELQTPKITDNQDSFLLENNHTARLTSQVKCVDDIVNKHPNLSTSKDTLAPQNAAMSNDSQDLSNNERNEIEQDDEVARKIAMLPRELAKVLGTIPTNHRNQLLNILPQYVSAPVPNIENDEKTSSAYHNPSNNLTRSEYNESTRLTVNTAISPSSVIPKKRHSPSQSRGIINPGEPLSSASLMTSSLVPAVPQQSLSNINDSLQSSSVVHNYLEKSNENFNITDFGALSVSPVIPAQLPAPKIPTKQKISNEQTASLRAVRIKTTSSRKSFCDDKKILVNYSYKTNPIADENCAVSNLLLTQDITKSSGINTEFENTDNKLLNTDNNSRTETNKDTSYVQDLGEKEVKIMAEKEYISASDKHKEITDLQNNTNNASHHFADSLDLQNQPDVINSSLTYVTESSSVDNQSQELGISLVKPLTISSNNDKTYKSTITRAQYSCDNLSENTFIEMQTENVQHMPENDVATDVLNSNVELSEFGNVLDEKRDLPSQQSLNNTEITDPQVIINNKLKPEDDKSNEDDSEDDISLAAIKQKKMHVDNSINSRRKKTKANLKNEKVSKQHKKNAKDAKINKQIELTPFNDEGKNIKSVDTPMKQPDLDSIEAKLCYVDKENTTTKSLEVLKDNVTRSDLVAECSDNTENTHITNIDITDDLVRSTDGIKEQNLIDGCLNESFDVNCTSDNDKEYNKSKKPDEAEKVLDVVNSNPKNTMQKDECMDLPEVKFRKKKATCFSDLASSPTDFQLCSEISEVNVLPLRRSRRGKSMYIDSSHIKDSQNITEATPLTMKRLILSRVEKDKKRMSESSIPEESTELIDSLVSEVILPVQEDDPKTSSVKKGKQAKRKKSPISRKTKKMKQSSHELVNDNSDISSGQSENNSLILRELPNADKIQNIISDGEVCKENGKEHATSDQACLSKNSTTERDTEIISDNSMEAQETSTSPKRKININKEYESNLHTSSRHTNKNKSQSDFDSDDDKVLVHTKQCSIKNLFEEGSVPQDFISEKIEKEAIRETNNLNEMTDTSLTVNANIPVEIRTTCYSRSVSHRKPRSTATLKKSANYDPYDIDFEDMLEISKPIIKKRGKNNPSAKLPIGHKKEVKSESLDCITVASQATKLPRHKTVHDVNQESDSDSSKSDVPLQKYIDEKELELKNKNVLIADPQQKEKLPKGSDIDIEETIKITEEFDCKLDEPIKYVVTEDPRNSYECLLTPKKEAMAKDDKTCNSNECILIPDEEAMAKDDKTCKSNECLLVPEEALAKDNKTCESYEGRLTPEEALVMNNKTYESERSIKDVGMDSNIKHADLNKEKQLPSKQKKTRRRPTVVNDADNVQVFNEDDQKMRSDKFMENFGFYAERIPRKSNILATKKISETFHMISNDNDDCFSGYKEKTKKTVTSENKKKTETSCASEGYKTVVSDDTAQHKPVTCEDTTFYPQSTESKVIVEGNEPLFPYEPDDVQRMDDSDLDSLTAQAIMNSEEVRNLENDLFSGLREAAKANAAGNCFVSYQATNVADATPKDVDQNESAVKTGDTDTIDKYNECTKKPTKNKPDRQSGPKAKMYPDIEEIDMFEDKFDKIKRKRRSQAVAAKQQITVEMNASSKSRKQSEKKRNAKSTKKNYQSGQVPTKGALKGFECIKISIPTQDLNLPTNVSLPQSNKRRRRATTKRRKEWNDSESSGAEFEEGDKFVSDKDIYEFQDSEDTEIFGLRPSTVMDRFRSMHTKSKSKHKDKEKEREDKSRVRRREKRKNCITKTKKPSECSKSIKRSVAGDDSETDCYDITLQVTVNEKTGANTQKSDNSQNLGDDTKKEFDNAVPGTSGFVPDRIDESDYESELSSPEGDFIFYTSNDVNCACPSEIESDESDNERGCGRLNCLNKNKNADKITAIGNIFKNNAVRCEKPEVKEPDIPKPDFDQLFDRLLETENKSNDTAACKTDASALEASELVNTTVSLDIHHDHNESKKADQTPVAQKDIGSNFDPEYLNLKRLQQSTLTSRRFGSKNSKTDVPIHNPNLTNSDLLPFAHKPNVSTLAEKSTRPHVIDINCENNLDKQSKMGTASQASSGSLDFSFSENPEYCSIRNRAFPELVLPAEKASTCAQVDSKLEDSDAESGNESAASKYLKGLTPSEAANMEIYTMVSAQGTQTDTSNTRDNSSKHVDHTRTKSVEEGSDSRLVPRSRIRLQKYDVRENSQKTKATKSIQTEKDNTSKPYECVQQSDSDEEISLHRSRAYIKNERGKIEGKQNSSAKNANEEDMIFQSSDVVTSTQPSSKSGILKHSPRKLEEWSVSSDAFEFLIADAGVARQRARRKCTVGKQNVLAEHWSSESEIEGGAVRPSSAASTVVGGARKKRRKREGHSGGRRAGRGTRRAETGEGARPPPAPKIRARAPHHYWSSEGEEAAGPQPQHGWIVGDSHKKLVTMLAHAKGRKRSHHDRHDRHAE